MTASDPHTTPPAPPVLLETLALDQHQERWSMALLPFVTVMIIVLGATFLFVLIDLGSASHLTLEPQAATDAAKLLSTPRAPEASPPANSKNAAYGSTSSPSEKRKSETASSPKTTSTASTDATGNSAIAEVKVANMPLYPLLQADDVRDPFVLAKTLAKEARENADFKMSDAAATVSLSSYLWNHFDEQTKFRLRHVRDANARWPPLGALIHSQATPEYAEDITSPARLRTILADALNKQLDDEAIAIRFGPERWLIEARRMIEQKGEPEFHAQQIKNPRRLARQIKDLPAGKLSAEYQQRIASLAENRAAQGKPDFSPQETLAGSQALAAKLNVLLYGGSLCRYAQFSQACASLPAALTPATPPSRAAKPPLTLGSRQERQGTSTLATEAADTTLLANRVMLEQTYADYLEKAEPALPKDTLRRINREALMRGYASLHESPDPAPTPDVMAERQSGRLAWFTYVGLNFAVCLCVFFAGGGIILAAAQTRLEQTAVPRVRRSEVDFRQLLRLLQKNSLPFHDHLWQLMDVRCREMLSKHPVEGHDELPRNLQDNLIKSLNRLLAGFSLAKNDKIPLTWAQRMRETLPFIHLSTEHSVEVYRNLRQIIEFDPAWLSYSEAQKQQIRERIEALERQDQLPPNHRWLLSWLLAGLSIFALAVILLFPIDKGTLGGFLAITAQRDMTNLLYLLALFEKVELTAAMLLAFATCTVLMPPSEEDKATLKRRAQALPGADLQQNLDNEVALYYAGKMQNLRTILYISTAVLASAVLQVSFTYSWGLTYLPYPHGDIYKQFELLARTIVTARGIYYSLLLASIYLPATFVLRSLTATLAEEAWRHRAKAQAAQSSGVKVMANTDMPAPSAAPVPSLAPATLPPASWIQRLVYAWKIGRGRKKRTSTAAPFTTSPVSGRPDGGTEGDPAPQDSGKTRSAAPVTEVPLDNTLDSREKWLKDRALASETWEMVPRFTAILLPLLTGPAAEIIKSLIPSIGSKPPM